MVSIQIVAIHPSPDSLSLLNISDCWVTSKISQMNNLPLTDLICVSWNKNQGGNMQPEQCFSALQMLCDINIKWRLQWESEMYADFRFFQIISLIGFSNLQIFIFYPAQRELCDNITVALQHRRHCKGSQNKLSGGSYSSWGMHKRKWRGNRLSQQDMWHSSRLWSKYVMTRRSDASES